jgi:hypothetical protein
MTHIRKATSLMEVHVSEVHVLQQHVKASSPYDNVTVRACPLRTQSMSATMRAAQQLRPGLVLGRVAGYEGPLVFRHFRANASRFPRLKYPGKFLDAYPRFPQK